MYLFKKIFICDNQAALGPIGITRDNGAGIITLISRYRVAQYTPGKYSA